MASHFSDILNAIRKQLADKSVVPAQDRVVYWARRKLPPHLYGDIDLVIRTKGITSPQDIVQGAGRLARVYRTIEIICRCRDARDQNNSDELWLTDPDRGLFALEEAVIDALEMFQPETADKQDVLTGEPIRFLTTADPDRETETTGKTEGWGSSSTLWQVMYEPVLDQTRQ